MIANQLLLHELRMGIRIAIECILLARRLLIHRASGEALAKS